MAEIVIPHFEGMAIQSGDPAYAPAVAGTGEDLEVFVGSPGGLVGQRRFTNFFHTDESHPPMDHPNFYILDQGFMSFDTSVLSGVDVSSIEFRMWWLTGELSGVETDRLEIRKRVWRPGAAADWFSPADFAAAPLLAHRTARVTSQQEVVLDLEPDFLSHLNLSGVTEMVVMTEKFRTGVAPTANNLDRRPRWGEWDVNFPAATLVVQTQQTRAGFGIGAFR